ncbi:helix-turn-helix domain-containing protein [Hymenobacter sp. CRA2]|uniref:helix-turn-helix domain-containing protein n=1 Tax=Hymenobacter sp. CRA2 TaxID=1955620 RepID=UPI00098FE4D7|nr:helix-turn-helix domain-containing protein [Hymenobacter sp. CRA2]OON69947.1 hypothetical protein B0919_04140 [Hymenobacter sp. CRA2]
MRFVSYLPCAALQPYIRWLAMQETDVAQVYKVLPDTGLVIGFQYRGGLAYHEAHGPVALATAGITGIRDEYRLFENTPGTGTVLVVFKEGGAAPFFRLPLHELAHQSVSLDQLVPHDQLAALQDDLHAATTEVARVQRVEALLLALLRPVPADRLVQAALALLHQTSGTVRMTELAQQLGTSASPLGKRFRQAVGTSPKKLAMLIRLQTAMARYRPGMSLTELSYAAGFYDQAHFIHAFQTFAGQAPTAYFRDAK